jgi:tRNA A-37 threonylcarbamoyl transferase component Bud32
MTCTVTMPSETAIDIRTVSSADLYQANYQFQTPFIVELPQGEFFAEEVVRLIPKRRMVVFGSWRGVPAVAKLFYDRLHAARHLAADATGMKAMKDNKIPTPGLLYAGAAQDENIQILIMERILESTNLEALWLKRETDECVLATLHAVMVEVATQHVLGVMQRDMHLGNFLISGKLIYTLDGAQIALKSGLLPKKESMKNIALLLSQLGAGVQKLQQSLFSHYARARGWLLKPADTTEILFLIKQCDVQRWRRFEKKIFRNSTEFNRITRMGWLGMVERRYQNTELNDFLKHPESAFAHPAAVMLKNGRSSTVIKLTLDGRDYVIKRYNMKNTMHRLRRLLRPTRAAHSWRLAQKLALFQVNTAAPVAFIESNWLGLRGKSYFVMNNIAGTDAKSYLTPFEGEPYAAANIMQRISNLILSLKKLEMTHGDLKATNIIVDDHGRPYLIDLDGAREHISVTGLRKVWHQDINRFMRNFASLPALASVFKRLLREC